MQQWEYHVILRAREVHRKTSVIGMANTFADAEAGNWNIGGDEMLASLQRLGREGWELVSISSRASLVNSPLASEEMWVFKRPLSDTSNTT